MSAELIVQGKNCRLLEAVPKIGGVKSQEILQAARLHVRCQVKNRRYALNRLQITDAANLLDAYNYSIFPAYTSDA